MTQEFNNPIPVVVCMVPVYDDIKHETFVLGIRRSIEPQIGGIALPGGYIDPYEHIHAAASRELEEETGVFIPPEDWTIVSSDTTPSNRLLILLVADYSISSDIEFKPNNEVSELVMIDRTTQLCFPIHTEWVDIFFGDQHPCGSATCDCDDANCGA